MADDPFIKSIAKIAYAEDSSRAIVTFTTDNGVVTYQFSIFDLQTIVGAMSQMVLFAQSQTLSRGYHFVTPVLDVADAMAAPVADKNKLVLSVKLQNGIVCEFGLEPSVANRLREDIERAAKTLQDGAPDQIDRVSASRLTYCLRMWAIEQIRNPPVPQAGSKSSSPGFGSIRSAIKAVTARGV